MYIYIHPGFILRDSFWKLWIQQCMKIMILCYTRCPIIKPQDIIIAKLLPFPNKSKIINAIEYENPGKEFCCYGHFKKLQNIKGYSDYRTLIQCFAVLKK
jgi:hypothetical protein